MLLIIVWICIIYVVIAYSYKWIVTVMNYPQNPYQRTLAGITLDPAITPPLSAIIPVYNQGATIVTSVISHLHLSYPHLEIVVVNDGSNDNTLQVMIDHFFMAPCFNSYSNTLPTQRIRAIYRSSEYPQLRVIDKERGGIADALNAGINACQHPLFIQLGGKVVFHESGLLNLAQPFLTDSTAVASCGALRRVSTPLVRNGFLFGTHFPKQWRERFALIEAYRPPWISLTPGLVGMFLTSAVIKVGGYRQGGGDMDLITRIRLSFAHLPDAVRTLNEPLFLLQKNPLDPTRLLNLSFYNSIGIKYWVSLLAIIVFEWLFPVLETLAALLLLIAFLKGFSGTLFVSYILFTLILRSTHSILDLMLEDVVLRIYPPLPLLRLLFYALLQNIGYRQLRDWKHFFHILRWILK